MDGANSGAACTIEMAQRTHSSEALGPPLRTVALSRRSSAPLGHDGSSLRIGDPIQLPASTHHSSDIGRGRFIGRALPAAF